VTPILKYQKNHITIKLKKHVAEYQKEEEEVEMARV
jgi:hypothetical protein